MEKTMLALKDGKAITQEQIDQHLPHLRSGIRAGIILQSPSVPLEIRRRYDIAGSLPVPIP
jgi:hypothetical protein